MCFVDYVVNSTNTHAVDLKVVQLTIENIYIVGGACYYVHLKLSCLFLDHTTIKKMTM